MAVRRISTRSDLARGATPRTSTGDFGNLHADELSALLAVASEGSFVGAANLLGRDPTIVSKRIASLESRLAVRLLERTTRRVRLTDAGARLAERIKLAQSVIMEAEQEATTGATELRGNLRLAFPAALGRLWLAPLIPGFLRRYPALQLDIDYSERYTDLIGECFDAAIRVGTLSDSRLVAKRLAGHRRILAASPKYLRQYGVPELPQDLANHNCLEFASLANYPEWRLTNGKKTQAVHARGSLRSNDSIALLEAARAGVGILGAGEWLITRDIAAGKLVRVLPEWAFGTEGGIYIVRPSMRFPLARSQAFVEWLSEQFADGAPWER
ncbi:LysR family transcriptional regulator [Burkholderia pyrrocinia]|uniref:LysR family transcriptional regulator n=1 Tax=Burkholderia pyrrocinia TaxID=60550 RepID=UPI001576CC8D|nr:LysR family transcriptional regulator [Burkholderia pyrrocinia]NTX26732.1 LysR family transcriptional regulator [Burkholderia pyrrocinia]